MNEILFLLPAFIACLVLTGIHTYLGLHVIARGIIFLDIALAQAAAMGLTIAFLFGFNPEGHTAYGFALGVTFLAALFFAFIRSNLLPLEAIIGVSFVLCSAVTILLADKIPHGAEHLKYILSGNILYVTWPQIAKTAVIYGLLGVFHYGCRKKMILASTDPQKARERNITLWLWNLLFYLSFGIVITSSVQIAGILLVFSFLIMPALLSILLFEKMGQRIVCGWLIGGLASLLGLGLSLHCDLPSGPAIVAILGLSVFATFFWRWIYARKGEANVATE